MLFWDFSHPCKCSDSFEYDPKPHLVSQSLHYSHTQSLLTRQMRQHSTFFWDLLHSCRRSARLARVFDSARGLTERSGTVGRAIGESCVAGSSLNPGRATVLCPSAKHFIRCLVLIQHSKPRPDMTEKLLTVT